MEKYIISAEYDYISGYLRYAHKEMVLTEEEYLKFKELSPKEQGIWLEDEGEFIIDDFEVNDFGPLQDIKVEKQ